MSKIHLENASVESNTFNVSVSDSTKSDFELMTSQPRRPEPNSPITRLPVEIYTKIFQLFVDSLEETETKNALFLGLICSSWRDIVWGTPSLWTWVDISVTDANLLEKTQLMQACLDRSGSMPLFIYLEVSPKKDVFLNPDLWDAYVDQFTRLSDAVKAVSARWESISLIMPGTLLEEFYGPDISKLKKICLVDTARHQCFRDSSDDDISYEKLPDAPYYLGSDEVEDREKYHQPDRLILDNLPLRCIKASWAALTNVVVADIDIDDIFRLLEEAPLLEGLAVDESRIAPTIRMEPDNTTIFHGNLRTMAITAQDAHYAEIIPGRLSLPRLTKLFTTWRYGILNSETFIAFYQRSGCQLTSLSFEGMYDAVSLVAMLSIAPTLSHLVLMPYIFEGAEENYDYQSMVVALFEKLSEIYQKDLPDENSGLLDSSKREFLPELRCFVFLPSPVQECPKIIWDFLGRAYTFINEPDKAVTRKIGEKVLPIRPLMHFSLRHNASTEDPAVYSQTDVIDSDVAKEQDESRERCMTILVDEDMKNAQILRFVPETHDPNNFVGELQDPVWSCKVCSSAIDAWHSFATCVL